MGWAWLAVFGAITFAALRMLGVARTLGSLVAAALMLAGAGYAWQGRPALSGRPVAASVRGIDIDAGQLAFRDAILPVTPPDRVARATADEFLRAGDTAAAAQVLLRAIGARPREAALWTDLGGALAAHDQGQLSPAARLAFRRAWQLAPDQPGPALFLGQAYLQAGDVASARIAWMRAFQLTPSDAPWRADIAERLVLIDQFEAMAAGAPRQR